MDLRGKFAVVSGGTSGVGRATALALASRGAEVVVIGRDAERGEAVADALRSASGGAGRFLGADLSLHAASLAVAQSLASSWAPSGIEVTALHPGQVDTGIYRSFTRWPWTLARSFMSLFLVSVEKPAALASWLAFSPEARSSSGFLFPSVKNFGERRELRRDARSVARVLRTAREVLALTPCPTR
ncbi:MAG: SDR family NAD(P)-dependent oxidoreductase [Planctomycetota bacterium]